jgi:hypothetical protein
MDMVYAVNMLAVPAVTMFFAGLAMLVVETLTKPRAACGTVPARRRAPISTWQPNADPSNA